MNTDNEITCQVYRANIVNLSRIFKQVKGSDPIRRPGSDQSLVTYDRKKEKAQGYNFGPSINSLFGLGSGSEIYLLDRYESFEVIQKCKLNSTRYNALEIQVKSTISLIKGAELTVVESLARRDTPEKLLADFLFRWIAGELKVSANIAYEDQAKFKVRMAGAINEEGRKIGLNLNSSVMYLLPKQGDTPIISSLEIVEKQVKVQPMGYNGFVDLAFELVLEPDKSSTSITAELTLRDKDELKVLLKNMLQSFVRSGVSYNDIVGGLHNEVRTNLLKYWNDRLQHLNKGWSIVELKLSSSENQPEVFKREELEIHVVLKNAEIQLVNTVVLYLENAQLFKNSSVYNLDQWIKEKLQKVAQKVLSNLSYAEFVSLFDRYSDEIKKIMVDDVRMIGYKVELLQTSDPIGPQRLQIDFHLNNDEQIFETILNDKVRLNVIISGKIESLNHTAWNKTLSPKTDLTQEIKTDVLREIRNRILKVTPDNFYAKFNSEVPEEIKNSIKALLIERYNLKPDVDVHLKIEHSQLKDRLSELSSGSLYTNVDLYNNVAGYTIKFCILDVPIDKWGLFANKKYVSISEEKESIKEDLKIFVEKKLRQLVSEKAVGSKFLVDVVQKFAEEAVSDIRTNRFLNINIEKVIETANEIGDLITGGNHKFIKETILKLQNRRSAISLEITEAKKAEHPKRVKELEDELLAIEKTLNPGSSDEEISKLISLPAENRTSEKGNVYISGE